MKKIVKIFTASFLALTAMPVLAYSILNSRREPVIAHAEREEINNPDVVSGNTLNMRVASKLLYWDAVGGATGYQVYIRKNGYTVHSIDTTNTFVSIITEMNVLKLDSGQYLFEVGAKGVNKSGSMQYYYTSHVDQLEAPHGLQWIGNKACWEEVEGASSYFIQLYSLTDLVYSTDTASNAIYDLSYYEPQDGWIFKVRALGDGTVNGKRDSLYTESPAKGSRSNTIPEVASGNSLHMTVESSGLLAWDAVDGATGYQISLKLNGMPASKFDTTNTYYPLRTEMNSLKLDSGRYLIEVAAKGVSKNDNMYYYYTSHVDQLEAPHELQWWGGGYKAIWNEVEGADSYRVSLYNFFGLVTTTYTSDPIYDFESYQPQDGWTFKVQALGDGTFNSKRNSISIESPAFVAPKYSIGVLIADVTLDQADSGGQVYLETDKGVHDWTSYGGFSLQATLNTTVTLKAKPDAGYRFMGWRSDDNWVSSDLEYQFTANENRTYYAMFEKVDYYFILQPTNKTVAVNDSVNVVWSTNLVVDQILVKNWDETLQDWDEWEVIVPSQKQWDYDFIYDVVDVVRFKLEAYKDSILVATSNEFTISWVEPEIDVAQATIAAPIAGENPSTIITTTDERYTVSVNQWRKDFGDRAALGPSDVFEEGKSYQLNAYFLENTGYSFTSSTVFKVNEKTSNLHWGGGLGMIQFFFTAEAPAVEQYSVYYGVGTGSGSGDLDYVDAGTEITLKTPQELGFSAPDGQVFDAWEINETKFEPGDKFTINADTIIIALWKNAPIVATTLTATYNGENIIAGQKMNLSDISISITYSNDTKSPVDPGDVEYWYQDSQILDPANYVFESAGVYQFTIKYLGLETTMNITVVDPVAPKTLTGIKLGGTYKTEYTVGDSFSTDGMVVTALYSNGDEENVPLNEVTFTGYDMNQAGNQTVTVSWSDKTCQFVIHVSEPVQPSEPSEPEQPSEPGQSSEPGESVPTSESTPSTSEGSEVTPTSETESVPGSSETPSKPSSKGLSGGAVAGIVIGSVAVTAGIGVGVFFLLKKKGIILKK